MRKSAFADVLVCLLLIACGAPPAPAADAFVPDDASQVETDGGVPEDDADVDAGPTYPIDHGCDDPCTVHWRELAPLDQPIDHHTTFILERTDGAYLYVLGGVQADALGTGVVSYSARLQAAEILDDGTLGPWAREDFGYGIGFHAQAQYVADDGTDSLMWVGGILIDPTETPIMPGASPYALTAGFPAGAGPGIEGMHVGAGGMVARLSGQLTSATLHATAAMRERADGRDLFLIGGSRGSSLSNEALRYDTEADAWVADAALPAARSHHALIQHDGHLVILGGFSGAPSAPVGDPAILRSLHDDVTGHITGWEQIGTMDEPPWTASAFVRDGFVYVVGGGISGGHHGDGEFLDRVRRAPIEADGHIGAFTDVRHLPVARSHVHQTPVYGNRIYSVGGRISTASGGLDAIPRVFVGTFEE